MRKQFNIIALAAAFAMLAAPAYATCRQALVLALDVSSSVDSREYAQQLLGLAQALDDPQVRLALTGTGGGHVALMVFEWSGRNHQADILPWLEVETNSDVDLVISTLNSHERRISGSPTALGNAMGYGAMQLSQSPECMVKTIDISGDGVNNDGYRPKQALLNFNFSGVTVNGLVISNGEDDELSQYYRQEVITGLGAFVEVAAGYEDYARAIKRKLLRELTSMALSQLN